MNSVKSLAGAASEAFEKVSEALFLAVGRKAVNEILNLRVRENDKYE